MFRNTIYWIFADFIENITYKKEKIIDVQIILLSRQF